jgi:DNA-binding response OmpR family regulator
MDVVLVRYPSEERRLADLRRDARPRLILVENDAAAPVSADPCEDWIRLPAREADLRARVTGLGLRAATALPDTVPEIDDDGVMRFKGGLVMLPPVEARLARCLVSRMGSVVTREALTGAGWPNGVARERPNGRNALDVHVLRLRRHIAPVGLAIRTVRSRGYLIEAERISASSRASS